VTRFRERLLAGEQGRLVFDAVLTGLREAGLARRQGKQRLDSTHVLGLVARLSRLEAVRETLRLAIEAVVRSGLAPAWPDWSTWSETCVAGLVGGRRQTAEQWAALFERAGRETRRLLDWLDELSGKSAPTEREQALCAHRAAGLLRRVFDEQYEMVGGRPGARATQDPGAVKNPHDPEAQWATKDTKDKKGWVGYKAQVLETAPETPEPKPKGEPTEQFITELTTTDAISSDLAGMDEALTTQAAHGQEAPDELFVDAAYVSGETLAEAAERGRELVGPARPSAPHKGGLGVDRFDVDVAHRRAVCPAGKTSRQCSLIRDASQGTSYYRFEWAGQCDACPLRDACTRSRSGRRAICVGVHHDRLQARRREMRTEAFQQRMRQRNAIEGTVSELTRLGLRRTRYRGKAKTALANHFLAAACNVRRWLRLAAWRLTAAPA
jgi:hypothetical protein